MTTAGARVTVPDLRAARDDIGLFSKMVGTPLADWQAHDLSLGQFYTVLVGARRSGKTRALSVLAAFWAFRARERHVLIVSAGEDSARMLLAEVRSVMAGHPLLAGAVLDEQAGLVTLDNGSTVRAVAASVRAIRGKGSSLLIIDEAAYIVDDEAIIDGAAMQTVAAHTDDLDLNASEGRVVLACSPWDSSGTFFRYAMRGENGDPAVRTFRWRLDRCPWVGRAYIEERRRALTPMRFRAEMEADFIDGGEGLFSRTELMAAVAPYPLVSPEQARGGSVILGADWGRLNDHHAVCLLGVLDDYGANGPAVLYVPWIEVSQRRYRQQIERVTGIAKARPVQGGFRGGITGGNSGVPVFMPGSDRGYSVERLITERSGVGQPAFEALEDALGSQRVTGLATTQSTKETSFSRLYDLLGAGRIVLPNEPRLLKELLGLEATTTQNGGMTIKAAGSGHDDAAMALSFCALALDADLRPGPPSDPAGVSNRDLQFVYTPSGIAVPAVPRPRQGGLGRDRYLLRAT